MRLATKRIASLACAAALLLSVTACTGSAASRNTTPDFSLSAPTRTPDRPPPLQIPLSRPRQAHRTASPRKSRRVPPVETAGPAALAALVK